MTDKIRDPAIKAHEEIYTALKGLDPDVRKRVLSSVLALLGTPDAEQTASHPNVPYAPSHLETHSSSSRPVSLIELMQEKTPSTNAQRIALFAYYREKYEDLPRFERDNLKSYFAKAKLTPAANFDRDFVDAVKKGWIHEDGADSYLTSKGLEAVESAFPKTETGGARAPKPSRGKKPTKKARK